MSCNISWTPPAAPCFSRSCGSPQTMFQWIPKYPQDYSQLNVWLRWLANWFARGLFTRYKHSLTQTWDWNKLLHVPHRAQKSIPSFWHLSLYWVLETIAYYRVHYWMCHVLYCANGFHICFSATLRPHYVTNKFTGCQTCQWTTDTLLRLYRRGWKMWVKMTCRRSEGKTFHFSVRW